VAGFHLIALQVGNILLQAKVGAPEILILVDRNGHATVEADRGDLIAEPGRNLRHPIAALDAELFAPEIRVLEEAGTVAIEVGLGLVLISIAVPITAPIPVAVPITVTVLIAIIAILVVMTPAMTTAHLNGRYAIIPAVAGTDLIGLQVGDVFPQTEVRTAEVAILVDRDFSTPEDANGRNAIVKPFGDLAHALAFAHTELLSPKIGVGEKARTGMTITIVAIAIITILRT